MSGIYSRFGKDGINFTFANLRDLYINMPNNVDDLSESEFKAYKRLVVLCQKIADEFPEVAK